MPSTETSDLYSRLVGERLRDARKAMGLTQREVAERLGIGPSAVARIETGRENLTIGRLARVAGALGVGLDIQFPVPDDRAEDYQRAA